MNEIIIVLSVIFGVVVISTVVYFLVKHFLKDKLLDGDGMVNDRCLSCKYHLGGGMEGDSLSITVKENDNETLYYNDVPITKKSRRIIRFPLIHWKKYIKSIKNTKYQSGESLKKVKFRLLTPLLFRYVSKLPALPSALTVPRNFRKTHSR